MRKFTRAIQAELIPALTMPYWGSQMDVKRVFQAVGTPHLGVWNKDLKGRLRAYSSVGSYPLFYQANDGACLCAKCATEQATHRYDWPRIVDAGVNWEDLDMRCSNCNDPIESSAGN